MSMAPPFSHGDFVAALHRCATLAHLKQLHAHAVVTTRAAAQTTTFHLIRFASLRLTCLPYARRLFDATASPNVFLYSAMLSAYAASSSSSHATQEHARDSLALFLRMLRRGRPGPNQFVYPLVLRAACAVGVQLVRSIHCRSCKDGFYDGHDVVRTSLLDGYSRYGMMGDARKLFDGLTKRNVVSWTALVSGYARAGKAGDAIVLFERMPQRDVPAWNAIIAGCTQNGLFVEAVGIFKRMVDEGFRPNSTTVSCLLSACGHLGVLKIGKVIHGYAWRSSVGFGSSVVNGLIDMYGKCGNLMEAQWIFDEYSDKGLTTWNSLINCLALHGRSESAIAVFNEMRNEGVQPDVVTFVGLLNACTHGGFVDEGMKYFELMCGEHEIEPQIEHYGCVVDLLCRAGQFQDAMNFINDMKIKPDEVIWGSLLNACRIHRHLELGEHAIRKLLDLNPNNANYVVMLANLYSEGGFWEEVRKVRNLMKEDVIGKKLPGCSWIEVNRKTHRFYSGDDGHPESEDIYNTLDELATSMEMQDIFA